MLSSSTRGGDLPVQSDGQKEQRGPGERDV